MRYDIGIIGAGPGGYTAALAAAERGLSVVLFEEKQVGGTCLNRGCIPTKSLLHSVKQFAQIQKEVSDYPLPKEKILARKEETVARLRGDVEKLLKAKKVTLVNAHAYLLEHHTIVAANEKYEVEHVILASGSKVSLPPIEGIDSPYVMTSDDLLEESDLSFSSVTIIGGGVIGVECASIFLSMNLPVTILEIADHILPTMDAEIAQRLNLSLKKKGAQIVTKVSISRIDGNTVYYSDKAGKECSVTSDKILVAAGRKANICNLVNPSLALEIKRGIVGDAAGMTNISNIFVIGDAKNRNIQLAHVAEAQGRNAVSYICDKTLIKDMSVIPSCVYTDPEIASVGDTQKEAEEAGLTVHTKKTLTGANGKSVIEEAESGYVKVVLDEEDTILGAQMVCPHATELIGEFAILIQKKMKLSDLREVVFPHPTVSEMISSLCE